MRLVHKALDVNIEIPEILQGEVEQFEVEISPAIKEVNENGLNAAVFNGAVVRAACNVGWLPGISADDVSKMSPNKVAFLSRNISTVLSQAREIPPQ